MPDIILRDNGPNLGDITLSDAVSFFAGQKRIVREQPFDVSILFGRVVRRDGFSEPPVLVENFNDISRVVLELPPDPGILSGRVVRREGVSHNIHILSISDVLIMSDTPTRTIVSKGNTIFYGTNN